MRDPKPILDDLSGYSYTHQTREINGQTHTLAKFVLSKWMPTTDPLEAQKMLSEEVEKAFGPLEGLW